LISTLGLAFAFCNWASFASVIVCAFSAIAYRIYVEEHALVNALGDEYVAYASRTKRLIPGVF